MSSLNNKKEYQILENFFPNNHRGFLPVNLFMLRADTNTNISIDSRFYIESIKHKNSRRIGGIFHKTICNTI
jgi:hypothetical protein